MTRLGVFTGRTLHCTPGCSYTSPGGTFALEIVVYWFGPSRVLLAYRADVIGD